MSTTVAASTARATRPYVVVSGDSHAGPSLGEDLRPYCPPEHLDAFDVFANAHRESTERSRRAWVSGSFTGSTRGTSEELDIGMLRPEARADGLAKLERVLGNAGSRDSAARLRDMDDQGIAAELIFAGAQNREVLPWVGGTDAGSVAFAPELRKVGARIWNAWLADFCAAAPHRLLGVAQIPIWDVPAAIDEIRWAREHGLRAINFPAPRPDYASYNETDVYEPFWSAVEESGLPLVTHTASGEAASGARGTGALLVYVAENLWLSRRALSQLIFGQVFERHPQLRLAFVEQRANWVGHTLSELDSQCLGASDSSMFPLLGASVEFPPRLPSEYWAQQCFVADSFMAPFEVHQREQIGVANLLWGSDYPHLEGTWPHTGLSLRNTFAGVPEPETRAILGDNGIRLFGLDADVMQGIADQIGPTPAELSAPLEVGEFPAFRGLAFRRGGSFH